MGLRSSQFNTAPRGETFEYLEGECNIALTVIKYVVLKKKIYINNIIMHFILRIILKSNSYNK